jgi:positive regulator of sigma E activity
LLYQIGIVVEARDQTARVEFLRSSSCGGCSGDQGCGLGPILAMFHRPRPHSVELYVGDTGPEFKVGETVRIAMAGHQFLKIVTLAYLLPLLGMFSGAWLAAMAIPVAPDISAVAGTMVGLFCISGLLARTGPVDSRRYLKNAQFQPLMPVKSGRD